MIDSDQSSPTHVVVVNYGSMSNVVYAMSDAAGADKLAIDAAKLGYKPVVMTKLAYLEMKNKRTSRS